MEIVAGVFGSGLEGREERWGELRSPLRRAPALHLQLLCLVTQPLEVSYIKRIWRKKPREASEIKLCDRRDTAQAGFDGPKIPE